MLIVFWLEDNQDKLLSFFFGLSFESSELSFASFWLSFCMFLCLKSLKEPVFSRLKEQLVFHDLSYVLKHEEDIFSFLAYKTLRASYIIFLKFFPFIFFWCIVYSFPVIVIYKRFNFCYSLWIIFYFFII